MLVTPYNILENILNVFVFVAAIVLYDVDITDRIISFNITCKVQFSGDHWETLSITNENNTQEFVMNQTGHNHPVDGFVLSHSISEGHITLNAAFDAPKETMCSYNDMYTCSLKDTSYTIVEDTSTIRILGTYMYAFPFVLSSSTLFRFVSYFACCGCRDII